MKGLKKVALASAIAAVSAGAQAELKALDDSAMGELTGQAGITIDVETKYEIGEFVYRDAGALVIEGIRMGSNDLDNNGSEFLDNFRMTIDVAGAGAADPFRGATATDNVLTYGFSEIRGLAAVYLANGNGGTFTDMAAGIDSTRQDALGADLAIDAEKTYGDGDLVIHFGFTDAWEKGGGFAAYSGAGLLATDSFANAEDIATRAVDFKFEIDAIGLADSTYAIGANANDGDDLDPAIQGGTTLISNLSIQGYLGPADLHIENDGDGVGNEAGEAGALGAGVSGAADSKITWGSYVNVTDLDITIDIAGVTLENVKINNTRGDLTGIDGTSAFGFAHSIRTIYRVENDVLSLPLLSTGSPYTDGLALNTQFKGDIDVGAIRFGDDPRSIGELFLTDIESTTNWTISAH